MFRASGPSGGYAEVDRFDGGVGWIAHPEEEMERAGHALAVDGDVWVVDPVDAEGVDDLLAEFGEVAGVVMTLDRHERDAAAFARRHDVPVYQPRFVERPLPVPVERFAGELADTGFRARRVVDLPGWSEATLCDGETLVCADALGGADYFHLAGERLGVHPALRPFPPRSLADLDPERVLVGHGEGVLSDGAAEVRRALDVARSTAPRVWWRALRTLV